MRITPHNWVNPEAHPKIKGLYLFLLLAENNRSIKWKIWRYAVWKISAKFYWKYIWKWVTKEKPLQTSFTEHF